MGGRRFQIPESYSIPILSYYVPNSMSQNSKRVSYAIPTLGSPRGGQLRMSMQLLQHASAHELGRTGGIYR